MKKISKVIKFEDMNSNYMDTQVEGLIVELKKGKKTGFKDMNYIREKLDNIERFFNITFGNFKQRILNEDIQKEFLDFLDKE